MPRRAAIPRAEPGAPMRLAPRVRAADVAAALCLSVRAVQTMAKRGDLPGAAQVGKLWTFDVAKLRAHIAAKEAECAQAAPKLPRPRGCEPPASEYKAQKAYEQAMRNMLGKAKTTRSKK
jgi:hypothetical protein